LITGYSDAPYPTIFYWFRGGETEQESALEIQSKETIWKVKEQLTKRHAQLRDVPAACIQVYRILEDNIEEYLDKMNEGKRLNGRQKISDCFADLPVLQTYCVVIEIVQTDRK